MARGGAGVDQCLAEVRRGLAHGIRSFLVGDLGVLATLGRPASAGTCRRPRPEDVGPASLRERRDGRARSRSCGATTINVSTDLSVEDLGEIRERVHRAARRLRRGARRPGRVRPLLRGARHDPGRRADVREARAPERAEHLPRRHPSRGAGREARSRARPPRRARRATARGAGAASWSRAAARTPPISPSPDRRRDPRSSFRRRLVPASRPPAGVAAAAPERLDHDLDQATRREHVLTGEQRGRPTRSPLRSPRGSLGAGGRSSRTARRARRARSRPGRR